VRETFPTKLENGRIRFGYFHSPPNARYGSFVIPGPCGRSLKIIATDGGDLIPHERWEHVSISIHNRPPNWQEMSFVKDLFWDETETVIQFHPPKSEYVNNHPHCLHLWKPPYDVPLPPQIFVGVKDMGNLLNADR
jgi:hypothetical protein